MKLKHALMAVGFAVSAWLAFFGDKPVDDGLVAPSAHRERSTPTPVSVAAAAQTMTDTADSRSDEIRILNLVARSNSGEDEVASGSRLFSSHSWTPPPKPVKPPPPPPPMAPPLPFTYLGMQQADGHFEVYLQRGEEVLVVNEKTVIDNIYRIESIKPPALSLVYLPLNQTQMIAIGATD